MQLGLVTTEHVILGLLHYRRNAIKLTAVTVRFHDLSGVGNRYLIEMKSIGDVPYLDVAPLRRAPVDAPAFVDDVIHGTNQFWNARRFE